MPFPITHIHRVTHEHVWKSFSWMSQNDWSTLCNSILRKLEGSDTPLNKNTELSSFQVTEMKIRKGKENWYKSSKENRIPIQIKLTNTETKEKYVIKVFTDIELEYSDMEDKVKFLNLEVVKYR